MEDFRGLYTIMNIICIHFESSLNQILIIIARRQDFGGVNIATAIIDLDDLSVQRREHRP